ncbi:hypothetical protein HELRODRAFT_169538 [Helobdella robusta]|uniref:Uncharacterized protein n=1 Tax=Helobdella robusta TaxID=6412 RepID=T1F223_HELRO|nr:hypothetical protein HELRODRAFT_169538 [Helobdella robusta]ESO08650.1 hypothetical protein HELRODRAFT_169538 [Helobdella robusta]
MNTDPATNNCGTPNSPFLSGHNSSKKRPSSDAKALKRNKRGETPLHIAAIKGDAQMADKLIKAGVDLNIKDYAAFTIPDLQIMSFCAGWSPLHEACSHGFMQVARSLLEAGAHVNILGLDNDLPLHDAACNGHFQVVELLLKHGANPFFKNLKGESAIDVANGDDVVMLLKNGYVTNSNNSNSTTATTTSSTATNHSNHNNNNNNNNRINMRSPATPESLTSNYEDEDRTKLKIGLCFCDDLA